MPPASACHRSMRPAPASCCGRAGASPRCRWWTLAGDQGNDLDTDPFYRFGPTRFSVIPHAVVGNVSVRFVPDQVRRPLDVWPGRSRRLAWTQVRPLVSVCPLHRTQTSS